MRRSDDPDRLADAPDLDEWVVGLLHGTGPYKSPPGRKQRVLLSLGRPTSRRTLVVLRPVMVAGVLIACGALAAAAIGPWRGWLGRHHEGYERDATPRSSEPVRFRAPAPSAPSALASVPEAIASAPRAIVPLPSTSPAAFARRGAATPLHARRGSPPPLVAAAIPAPAEEDPQMVMAGMRALRSEGDPVRARRLLGQYLEQHGDGPLAEEALALSIEAALAHRDADVVDLGRRYIRQYPAGRFTALALRAQH